MVADVESHDERAQHRPLEVDAEQQSPVGVAPVRREQRPGGEDPDEFLRAHGPKAWPELLEKRECGVTWRARDLLSGVEPDASKLARRDALRRAGAWLGTLPPSLALEQDDAVRDVASRCGYDVEAVTRVSARS
jgi:hypothetical protein